jgi:hypothetical protein
MGWKNLQKSPLGMTGEPPVATGHHFLPLLGTKAKVK